MADDNDTLLAGGDDCGDTDVTQVDGAQKTVVQSDRPSAAPTIPDIKIIRELGRGGMGVVYEGRQTYVDRRVAVKVLLRDFTQGSSQFADRFQREAKILARLQHPHIVSCYQAGVADDGGCYLVMEFIEGSNLEEWLCRHGALSVKQALGVVRVIATALQYAHTNGIIHRDVKAENILLGKDAFGDLPFTPKLVDLGLARPDASADMQLTAQGVIMGTPATMAPEQFDDPDHVDLRADIYGLGCVLYQALCAQPAFCGKGLTQLMESKLHTEPPDPRAINSDVPAAVSHLIKDMLAKDPAKRVQDYEALLQRLDTCGCGAAASPGKKPGSLVVAAVLLTLCAAIIGLVVLIMSDNNPVIPDAGGKEEPVTTKEEKQTANLLQEQSLIQDGLGLASWWTVDGGSWGHSDDNSYIVGYAMAQEAARLQLRPPQPVQRLDALIGANPETGDTAAFNALEMQVIFEGGQIWKLTINDFGPSQSIVSRVPQSSGASDDGSTLVPPRAWPVTLQRRNAGWQLDVASFRQILPDMNVPLEQVQFSVKKGNCFLKHVILNKGSETDTSVPSGR